MERGAMSKRILVLAIALLVTVVPVAAVRASDRPTIASTPTLLEGEVPSELEGLGLEEVTPLLREILERV
jgi:hypothetical protein